jgi:hypothetical protein
MAGLAPALERGPQRPDERHSDEEEEDDELLERHGRYLSSGPPMDSRIPVSA